MNCRAVQYYMEGEWEGFNATDRWITVCLAGVSDELGIIDDHTVPQLAQVCGYQSRDKWFRKKLAELAGHGLILIDDLGPSGQNPRLVITMAHYLKRVTEGGVNV